MGNEIGETCLRHSTIDDKIRPIDETALVTGKEEDGLGLFDCFAEATGWEVDLAAMAFSCVVAQPVLEEGSAVGYQYSLEDRTTVGL